METDELRTSSFLVSCTDILFHCRSGYSFNVCNVGTREIGNWRSRVEDKARYRALGEACIQQWTEMS